MFDEITFKSVAKIVVAVIIAVTAMVLIPSLMEEVDAGEIVVIQTPVSGQLNVYTEAGWVWQGGGKATHYKKSNQFWFLSSADKQSDGFSDPEIDGSLPVTWNDGGSSTISGSARYDMPLVTEDIIKVHSIFGSQESIERQLVKTNLEKSIFLSGPLMSSKESYAEKRSDLISLIEDQANKGVYRTKVVEAKEADPLTGEAKTVKKVEIIEAAPGNPARQEQSTISLYNLRLYNVAIKNISYDERVIDQIKAQQKSIMDVQLAQANALRAQQDAITAEEQGKANAASAKWEIEVTKAKQVTEAQARKEVAELEKQTAALLKEKLILEGQGEAEKKRLIMAADGALDPKLKAWLQSQQYWADAFSKYTGNLVPLYSTGGYPGASGNAGINFMELMGAKAAKDLMLDLSMKK
jgi:regulator of protease activity HflC (stomatin/prohibitin superfamily)